MQSPDEPAGLNRGGDSVSNPPKLRREQLLDPLCEEAIPASKDFPGKGAVVSFGQVGQIQLPEDWVGTHKNRGENRYSYREFHPEDNPQVMMVFYNRGMPLGQKSQGCFRDVLKSPPHDLSKAELQSLSEVLGDQASPDDFSMASARTVDFNGKRILIVQGRYAEIEEDALAMYIDADGQGTFVEEIFFQAPKDEYLRHRDEVDRALGSIRWRG